MVDLKRAFIKNSSTICTVSGVIFMIAGTVLAVRATKSALEHLKEEDVPEEASKKEKVVRTVKATWKDYTWAGLCEVAGVSLIFGGHQSQMTRNRQLTNLLYASDLAYRNLQDKLDEKLTKKQVADIRDSIAEDKIKKNPPENNTIIVTDKGNHLFFDSMTGQYFRNSYEEVHKAMNQVNADINADYYVQMNELISLWGEMPCKTFENLAWYTGEQVDVRETNMTINGEEVTSLEYNIGSFRS